MTCAITGAVHTPSMTPHLPITSRQIADAAVAAAGASIVHLHARDPRDGRPVADPALFREFLPVIREQCDAVLAIRWRWRRWLDKRLPLWLPKEMHEVYVSRESERVTGVAKYSNYRRGNVTARVLPQQ